MKLLFIDGGSRWKIDIEGKIYTDATYNQDIWERYLDLCDNLVVLLRSEDKIYSCEEAQKSFNIVKDKKINCIALTDIYNPKKNAFNIHIINKTKRIIKEHILNADRIIIRSLGNFYTNTAAKYCIHYKKPFLVEVTGFVYESLWYHSVFGKIVAPIREAQYKSIMRKVDYAIYVTEKSLQKRYPCRGISIGCSDVELEELNEQNVKIRKHTQKKIVLGTAAFLDVKWKGQEYVLKALAELKKKGITNIEYRLIGGGNGKRITQLSEKLGINRQVKIIGALSHDQVFKWLDTIDIYIQPSFQEGLCRSIVEAMSRGCPVICSNVGGNVELVPSECLFEKGNINQIAEKIEMMTKEENQIKYSRLSFEKSKKYSRELLRKRRNEFYTSFIHKYETN